jgi:diaminohydroxyphosphoribosylaminopyrimidine deaminase/5-amino-6-(5-phosphoribosylamino)uracil reductase
MNAEEGTDQKMIHGTEWSDFDTAMMERALELARKGRYTVTPNPMVGCVIVRSGRIIGEGFHIRAGTGHAEVNAITAAGGDISGADVYVTLEPCSHYGRTPPCAEALIRGGVRRVVAAMKDPNPAVSGRGLKMMTDAGINVECGLLSEKAESLNPGFFHRMRTGRPFVRLKMGCSMDGRTALSNGESKWITSEQSRADVQNYRALSCAILTTSGTVLADNPVLNVRKDEMDPSVLSEYPLPEIRQPMLALVDTHGRITDDYRIFSVRRDIVRFTSNPAADNDIRYRRGEGDIESILQELGRRQVNNLWIEAGGTFAGSVIGRNLADEIILYLAPSFLGADGKPVAGMTCYGKLTDVPKYVISDVQRIGPDLKVVMGRTK